MQGQIENVPPPKQSYILGSEISLKQTGLLNSGGK